MSDHTITHSTHFTKVCTARTCLKHNEPHETTHYHITLFQTLVQEKYTWHEIIEYQEVRYSKLKIIMQIAITDSGITATYLQFLTNGKCINHTEVVESL